MAASHRSFQINSKIFVKKHSLERKNLIKTMKLDGYRQVIYTYIQVIKTTPLY